MSNGTLLLQFTPGVGNTIRLSVSDGSFDNGNSAKYVLGPPAVLPPPLLDALQSGALTDAQRAEIENAVTDWLLGAAPGNGLSQTLLGLVNPAGATTTPTLSFSYDPDLTQSLLTIPLEMARIESDPLALFGPVRSVVHELESLNAPPPKTIPDWPFRLLLFRAAPKGLEAVPPIEPIAARLRNEIDPAGEKLLIKAISSEGGGEAATFRRLFTAIETFGPHAAVFLGHGVLNDNKSYLAFEGTMSEFVPISSADFRIQLQNGVAASGVPLIVLVGCLTAAQPAPDPTAAPPSTATVSRPVAFLGFAQEIIRSSLGVTASVGMRARIDGHEAETFLVELFRELTTGAAAGDVGAAVKRARVRLAQHRPGAISPYVPMVMQAKDVPPPLAFLSRPYARQRLMPDEALLAKRRMVWAGLLDAIMAKLALPQLENLRRQYDEDVIATAQNNLVIRPRFGTHTGPNAIVVIELAREFMAQKISCSVALPTDATVSAIRRSVSVAAAGFRLYRSDDVPGVMEIQLRNTAPALLPVGELVELDLTFTTPGPALRELSLNIIEADPDRAILGECNALIQTE